MNKICWQGLDKWISEKKLAKIVKSILPDSHGIVLARPKKKSFAFLEFPNVEMLNSFLELSKGLEEFGKKYKLKQANDQQTIKGKTVEELLLPRPFEIRGKCEELGPIRDKITPWWNLPYNEQLAKKRLAVESEFLKFIKDVTIRARKTGSGLPKWIPNSSAESSLYVKEVKPSPQIEEYRNKTEFTIGFFDESTIRVGFTNGKMSAGNLKIESARPCSHINEMAKTFAERIEEIVKKSGIPVFDTRLNSGIWKQATIRHSSRSNETMASIFISETEESSKIESLLQEIFPFYTTVALVLPSEVKVLSGPGFINETILGKKYQISPLSFFQVNTLGCEVLYQEVVDLVNGDLLLDVCCGTGSIGISCADKVKKVIGLEIIPEAVNDAIKNAEINGVFAEYKTGKAEDFIKEVTKNLTGENIFAVVDPPRSGLHKSILQCLRTTKGLDHLVYVSCNPVSLFVNLSDLCCPETSKIRGPAFVPISIQPVDMFPQTPHIETVVYLKRSTIID
jgi:tRNA (uracil-5-)-methyltransferase